MDACRVWHAERVGVPLEDNQGFNLRGSLENGVDLRLSRAAGGGELRLASPSVLGDQREKLADVAVYVRPRRSQGAARTARGS